MPASKEANVGIFDDIWSTVDEEKLNKSIEESNVDEYDEEAELDEALLTIRSESSPENASKKCVKADVKTKISSQNALNLSTSNTSIITRKQASLKNFLENDTVSEKVKHADQSTSYIKNKIKISKINNINDSLDCQKLTEKSGMNSTSFSDTFDLFSDDNKVDSKVPEEVPLFADMEPSYFKQVFIL